MRRLYLIRHAQSHLRGDVHHSEWPLSERGRQQAERLAELLAPLGIEHVVTSPFVRCRATIAPFVAAAGVPLSVDPELRERLVAPGLVDDFETVWRRSWEDFDFALPGCESSAAGQRRIWDAVGAVAARTPARTIAISSHGNVLSLLLNRLDPGFALQAATAMRNPDAFRLEVSGDELRWDASWQLPGLAEIATGFDDVPIDRTFAAASEQ